jgi:hypothetical protein
VNAKLATEQTRFQNFISNRTTPNYADVTHELSDQINGFEHQVTWQVDNNTAITSPNQLPAANASAGTTADTSNTSSGTTTATSNTSTGTTNTSSGTTTNTSTGTTTNTSTGTTALTPAQAIAAGFAALEAATSAALGSLSSAQTTSFQQLQQTLTTEQARFTAFIAARSAYQATSAAGTTTTGTTQDVSA